MYPSPNSSAGVSQATSRFNWNVLLFFLFSLLFRCVSVKPAACRSIWISASSSFFLFYFAAFQWNRLLAGFISHCLQCEIQWRQRWEAAVIPTCEVELAAVGGAPVGLTGHTHACRVKTHADLCCWTENGVRMEWEWSEKHALWVVCCSPQVRYHLLGSKVILKLHFQVSDSINTLR